MNITFTTDYEKKIYDERTHFVAVRGKGQNRTRCDFYTLEGCQEYAKGWDDKRTMIYAVNGMGSAAHIINL